MSITRRKSAANEALVAALEVEKEGYRRRGLDDRAKAVDAELDRLRKESPKQAPAKRAQAKAKDESPNLH